MQKIAAYRGAVIPESETVSFIPHAKFDREERRIDVLTEECEHISEKVSEWVLVFWKKRESWFNRRVRRRTCVGFSMRLPDNMDASHVKGYSLIIVLRRALKLEERLCGSSGKRVLAQARKVMVPVDSVTS